MHGSIVEVDALTLCALLYYVCDLKRILLRELINYVFVPPVPHKVAEATKKICWAKGEDAVNHSTVIISLKKFRSSFKNLDD